MVWAKNWFSNMLPLDEPFKFRLYHIEMEFYTVENFYQAMKANSDEEFCRIAVMTPFQAKNYWRNHTPYPLDEQDKLGIMEYALRIKFAQGTSWYEKLMATGDEEIIEWNNWNDTYWGQSTFTGIGQNHLGIILMKIREEHNAAKRNRRVASEKKRKPSKAVPDRSAGKRTTGHIHPSRKRSLRDNS